MLSYQHEYHAGNSADLFKHTCLVQILQNLIQKDKPFTIIDTHSSSGKFSLTDERLIKTGEAKEGIQKLLEQYTLAPQDVPPALASYLEIEKTYIENGFYAGSAELERLYLRNGDQLHLIEKHPQALQKLQENKITQSQGKVNIHNADAYKQLLALTPPLIKRGLILCDPSYEDKSDYQQVTETLKQAHKKWNTAIIALWYPLITRRKNETAQMTAALENTAKTGTSPCDWLKCEIITKDPQTLDTESQSHLYGSGMFIINPPWKLSEKLNQTKTYLETHISSN